jgi:maltose alpha-D-glucosyltransferase / alpha-amylase
MLPVSISELEQALPEFVTKQRWYRAKAKTITALRVTDLAEVDADTSLVLTQIDYQDGENANYVLACSGTKSEVSVIDGKVYDAIYHPGFRQALLSALACNRDFSGVHGKFTAQRTNALDADCDSTALESSVSRAEQSNSSIIFGQRYILKLFRKLEEGINPDIEIGRFLTEQGFHNTPAVLGNLEYRPHSGEPMQAGILMQFVPNQGDAWKYTLESLASFFEQANGNAPDPDDTAAKTQFIGPYLDSARLLARRTAEMHAALSSGKDNPDFAPEPYTPEYAEKLYSEMLHQADITFDLIRGKQNVLGESAEDAKRLIALEDEIRSRFEALRQSHIETARIRHHGDYHLGQVLWTGNDFIIIDFEGEPARPLSERRIKTFAMRDVAGMIRSFSYAGHAAIPQGSRNRASLESWAEFWGAAVSAEYLHAYFETANDAPFVGSNREEQKLLFDAFLLQKALYEVAYELNNRPAWVHIPLHGILNLIGNHGRRTQFA